MSQIFNSSPRFFPSRRLRFKKTRGWWSNSQWPRPVKKHLFQHLWKVRHGEVDDFFDPETVVHQKKTYTKKKQKEQKTRNASYTTTTIQNKNCLTRMYPAMAYIVCFKAHEGLKSKFVLATVIEFKIYVVHKSSVIHMQKSTGKMLITCRGQLPFWCGKRRSPLTCKPKMLKVVPSCVNFDRVPVTTANLSCLESARKKYTQE